ncbi:MAG: hypothetical protein ABR573_03930 [Candidatus Dormibacteria bacterium]
MTTRWHRDLAVSTQVTAISSKHLYRRRGLLILPLLETLVVVVYAIEGASRPLDGATRQAAVAISVARFSTVIGPVTLLVGGLVAIWLLLPDIQEQSSALFVMAAGRPERYFASKFASTLILATVALLPAILGFLALAVYAGVPDTGSATTLLLTDTVLNVVILVSLLFALGMLLDPIVAATAAAALFGVGSAFDYLWQLRPVGRPYGGYALISYVRWIVPDPLGNDFSRFYLAAYTTHALPPGSRAAFMAGIVQTLHQSASWDYWHAFAVVAVATATGVLFARFRTF